MITPPLMDRFLAIALRINAGSGAGKIFGISTFLSGRRVRVRRDFCLPSTLVLDNLRDEEKQLDTHSQM